MGSHSFNYFTTSYWFTLVVIKFNYQVTIFCLIRSYSENAYISLNVKANGFDSKNGKSKKQNFINYIKVSPNIRLLSYCVIKCDLPLRLKAYYYFRAIIKYSKEVNVNLISFVAYNIIQLPIFLLMVWSIRKIATEQDLTGTGILWFKNLNEADPYMILPIISVIVTYFNLCVKFFNFLK